MRRRLLVIEDDADIARLICLHLSDLDCEIVMAADGHTGRDLALSDRFDLVILDLGLPVLDGLEICRELRALPSYTPILILSARASDVDRVTGLETGSDDYLTKPFNVRELVARVKALLRRGDALMTRSEDIQQASLQFGMLSIDAPARCVRIESKRIELTAREFELLLMFATHPGRVFTRGQLLELVWGYNHAGYEHTVNTHINRLRSKIELDPSKPKFILTSWGVGYFFPDQKTTRPSVSNV